MRTLPIAWKSRLYSGRMIGLLVCWMVAPLAAAQAGQPVQNAREASHIRIRGYTIDVTLDPALHSLTAKTQVDFTALESLQTISFELNPALRVTGVTDDTGNRLSAASGNGQIVVTPTSPVAQGSAAAWTFTYSGVFDSDTHPATSESLVRLASIGDPVSYLLYAARWFPLVGYETDRFTATIHVHVPAGEHVVGSGLTGTPHADANGQMVFDFDWPHPGFPGTILVGKFREPVADAGSHVRVYRIDLGAAAKTEAQQPSGKEIAATANRQYDEFTAQFGPTEAGQINVVELPDGTLPAAWAPEIAAIASKQMNGNDSFRLLANTIAHQWWGNQVSPATRSDAWITNGMCRYAELEFLRQVSKPEVIADAIFNVSASALAYNRFPLAEVARDAEFSPEFQAMTYDKGAMIFRMLQWQIGDAAFQQTVRGVLSHATISSTELEQIAETASHQNLRPFFTQWLSNTGAPTLDDKWTLYRLGSNQGFRILGEIDEDLDLFQMPVEVRVETEGKTVTQRVNVMGPQTQFTIDTFGIPRKVSLDPERWLLRNDEAMQVRVHILRGMQKLAENDDAGAIQEYRAALALDSISSLANYRLGEVYFREHNYQAAEDAFRGALSGDGVPKWTEVWSDLQLGKIFDASGQRNRAVNQYREALETQDNTAGALPLAGDYLQRPYAAGPAQTHP
ncbi:MAG: M1 family aminopeptidase [Terriglobia bacterium]|nr:M1 family aminopeptidase [Terriglobia bacterium]